MQVMHRNEVKRYSQLLTQVTMATSKTEPLGVARGLPLFTEPA